MEKCQISDYVGSFLYLGAAMDKLAEAEPTKLPDPSCAQIRAAVTEYCVLPLGSQARYAEIASIFIVATAYECHGRHHNTLG